MNLIIHYDEKREGYVVSRVYHTGLEYQSEKLYEIPKDLEDLILDGKDKELPPSLEAFYNLPSVKRRLLLKAIKNLE
jgi:hypothetical protein